MALYLPEISSKSWCREATDATTASEEGVFHQKEAPGHSKKSPAPIFREEIEFRIFISHLEWRLEHLSLPVASACLHQLLFHWHGPKRDRNKPKHCGLKAIIKALKRPLKGF